MCKRTKGTLKSMGMSASQARLLSITARLSDNEFSAQALSYSKQRLADESEQVNNDYIEALKATKLQVITGFNGSEANYEDISYSILTGFNTVACDRQYVITNSSGKIVVSDKYAKAFEKGNGDVNIFLAELGVIQTTAADNITDDDVHSAWDEYFASVYGTADAYYEKEHNGTSDVTFGYSSADLFGGYATCQAPDTFIMNYVDDGTGNKIWQHTDSEGKVYSRQSDGTFVYDDGTTKITLKDSDGKDVTVADSEITADMKTAGMFTKTVDCAAKIISFDGATDEQRKLYDYAVALTTQQKSTTQTYNQTTLKNTDELDAGLVDYYKNILNQMATCGYVVETKENLNDNAQVEDKLKKGEYLLKYYSATDGGFVATSLSDDDAIQEVEDERQITLAEAKYTSENTRLEAEDNKIDLELRKLDSEHDALQTEYESVKNVIDKNVEKTFNVFS